MIAARDAPVDGFGRRERFEGHDHHARGRMRPRAAARAKTYREQPLIKYMRQDAGMSFRVVIIGGTGQVGSAVVRALAAEPSCAEVVMVNRRPASVSADLRVRQVVLDTAAARFPADVTALVSSIVAQGDPVYAASCVGVGQGSLNWSEEALKALEIGVVGGFALGCRDAGITRFALLSAVGSSSNSRIRYVRVMGWKEEAIRAIGFRRLALFRPGIIGGNVHTPGYVAWLGRLLPGRFGTIEQDDIGRAFAAEFINSSAPDGVVHFENDAMRQMSRALVVLQSRQQGIE